MKKYINTSFLFLIGLVLLTSCDKDFLELTPIDSVSNLSYWNTENDLATYNNGLYNYTSNNDNVPILWGHSSGNNNNSIFFQDGYTDNTASTVGYFATIKSGQMIIPGTVGAQPFGYKGWDFVRAINVGLENYNKAKISQTVIDKYIGEARLFRGWFYAEKVQKFGDVPWIETSLNIDSPELYAARMARDLAMEKILADLNFASTKLPDSWADGNAPGRINRWGALLVKARVCLYEGTWKKYRGLPDANKWLTEAANAAKELIDKGPYSLHVTGDVNNDYSSFQRAINLAGNKEVMYWKKTQTGVSNNNVQASFSRTLFGSTKSFVEDFLCTDGLPISSSPLYQGDATIEDVFKNRDPRLRQCILHPADALALKYDSNVALTYPRLPIMVAGLHTTNGGYHIIKNFNPAYIGGAFNIGETPAIVLRLAEGLLIYAEAQAELGLITQTDLDLSINKLRTRAGMPKMVLATIPVDPSYTSEGLSPIIVEIRRERRIELFNEGFRYNDLKRWKQGIKLTLPTLGIQWNAAAIARYTKAAPKTRVVSGKTYIDVYAGSIYANPVFDENKNYLWPIPLSSLAENPEIKQNPGWQ